jgi:hypothetical protein
LLRFMTILKSHNKVIGKTHDYNITV